MAIYYNQVFEKKLITVIMDQNWVIDFLIYNHMYQI